MNPTSSSQPSVLVLGAGFLGAAIASSLVARGCSVNVVTRSEPTDQRREQVSGATVTIADANHLSPLASALSDAEHVVFALSSSSPAESELDPANDVSLILPPVIRMLELLRLRPGVGLTFLSSGGTVYGSSKAGRPFRESDAARPASSYGIIKYACEQYISMYHKVHGIPVRILRISNAYGPGQPDNRTQGLVAKLLRSIDTGEEVPLYGADEAIRDYIYIDDAAAAVAASVCSPKTPVLMNIGSGVGHTVSEVVRAVEDVTGHAISVQRYPRRAYDIRANILDISRIEGQFEFHPRDLRVGLELTWKSRWNSRS